MFGLFDSQEKKMRDNAANWLELADKVYHFRRDVLPPAQVDELRARSTKLRTLVKEQAGAEKLKLAIESLEEILRTTGGAIYPKSALVENVEFFLVAAIVILGIRTYFVTPFKIPTNSMWPTYNGMTPEVWQKPEEAPGLAMKAVRFVLFGAQRVEAIAPDAGEVKVAVVRKSAPGSHGRLPYDSKPGRKWLVIPTTNHVFTFRVNGEPVEVAVPEDFKFDWALQLALGLDEEQLGELAEREPIPGTWYGWATLPRRAERGKPFLSFDILTGDQLFVDRVTYHFFPPQVGQGFVFRTENIHSPYMVDLNGHQIEQYYIKRLVGTPGDVLEVKQPVLFRNGKPITGAAAFDANGTRSGKYRGYFNPPIDGGNLSAGQTLTVPKNAYFAMGDNSADSQDGRYWGFVPAKDVVGRPLFVYFPFTRHWGPAK